MSDTTRVHWDLSEQIIGSAMAVVNALGPGLNEKLYENALIIELTSRGLKINQQLAFPVTYRGRYVGKLVPDLIVEEQVIVDTKVVESLADAHTAQMISYLSITKLELGLLLNFKHGTLDWKRIVNSLKKPTKQRPDPHLRLEPTSQSLP